MESEIVKKYELEILDLHDEKDTLKEEIEHLIAEIDKFKHERNQIEIQRNRLEVALQKTALGIDIVDFDNKKLIQENKALSQLILEKKDNKVIEFATATGVVSNLNRPYTPYSNGRGSDQCTIF